MPDDPNRFHHDLLLPRFKEAAAAPTAEPDAGSAESATLALLRDALDARASDIHLDGHADGVRLKFRIDGAIVHAADLSPGLGQQIIGFLKTHAGIDPAPVLAPEDSRVTMVPDGDQLDIRLACAPCATGEKLTLRLLRAGQSGLKLTDLGMNDAQIARLKGWTDEVNGILLVVGPIGSGKTTTLYSLLGDMDLSGRNVFTIEDPIEYQIDGINQMRVNAKRGLTFANGLRATLRHDPDFILLGEIRDKASAATALDAANLGHVILSTMHSRDAASVVTSLRIRGFEDFEIANSLSFVVAQRLVRKLCRTCAGEGKPGERDARWLESLGVAVPDSVGIARGCPECNDTGYFGRTGVFELWPLDQETYSMILDHADERSIRRGIRDQGQPSLLDDGLAKAAAGRIDLAELRRMGARSHLDHSGR